MFNIKNFFNKIIKKFDDFSYEKKENIILWFIIIGSIIAIIYVSIQVKIYEHPTEENCWIDYASPKNEYKICYYNECRGGFVCFEQH